MRVIERDSAGASPAPEIFWVVSRWAHAVVRALEAKGVDGRALAVRAGLDMRALDDPDGRLPITGTGRLWRLAVDATGDPAFGLFASRYLTFPTFQALGVALMASTSVKDALLRLVRYSRLLSDAATYRVDDLGDRYRLTLDRTPGAPLEHEAIDAIVSLIARLFRDLHGDRSVCPLRVAFMRPEPARMEPYERLFRAPITFGAPADQLEFARPLVEAPLPGRQAELAQHSDEIMTRYLARCEGQVVLGRVRTLIVEQLANGEPSQDAIARALGMSLRTLQRRLAEEGTSFVELVNQARRDLACTYLRESPWSVTEVAFILGFADVSSFSRAFRRWTGLSPTEYALHPPRPRR